jgi:hypothetical protein
VDAGGHRSVVPVENMSDAIIASGLMEETIMQPMTENGESNPEDVASAWTSKMIETVSAGDVLDSQGHDREPGRSNAHAAIIESTHESGAQETAERSVPSGCFRLTTLLTPHDTSVKECDAVTPSPHLVDATDHNPEDATTTSTSTMREAISPGKVIDNKGHAGEVDESTQLLSVALDLLSHGNTKAVTVSTEAQTSVATSATPPSLSTGNLSFAALVAPRGTQDKEPAAEAPASALSPAFVEGTDHRSDNTISVWEAEVESIHPFRKDETCETDLIVGEEQRVMNDLIENVASADRMSPVSTVLTTDYRDRCTTPTNVFSGSCCGLSVAKPLVATGTPATTANEVVTRAPVTIDKFDLSDDCMASSTERENMGD